MKKSTKFLLGTGAALVILGGSYHMTMIGKENGSLTRDLRKSEEMVEKLEKENEDINNEKTDLMSENKRLNDELNRLKKEAEETTEATSATSNGQEATVENVSYSNASTPVTTVAYTSDGTGLTASKGVYYGPSGKETYYNLNMSGVIDIMRGMGNNDAYWIREDGVKMLGNYVMVAADLNTRPRGTIIDTSLGQGIVCDTGGFAASNPTQLDIATAW